MAEPTNNTAAASKLAQQLAACAKAQTFRLDRSLDDLRLELFDKALAPIREALEEARRELAGTGADVQLYVEGTHHHQYAVKCLNDIYAKLDAAIALLSPGEGKGGA